MTLTNSEGTRGIEWLRQMWRLRALEERVRAGQLADEIVGAGTSIAVGGALAGRFDGTGRVTVTSFGDGAMNQGAVHEAMNFAATFDLPVVFICENNFWSEMTPIASAVRDSNLFRRATAYGMPGERIDGNDPEAVAGKVGDAFALAREGGGPTLIEAMTTRLAPHYIGDTEHYCPAEDRERARPCDPIALLTARLHAAGIGSAAVDAAEKAARAEMNEAYSEALGAPFADPSSAREHVYA